LNLSLIKIKNVFISKTKDIYFILKVNYKYFVLNKNDFKNVKKLIFYKVIDIKFGDDITIKEEANELIKIIKNIIRSHWSIHGWTHSTQ
ncbi:[Fe-Fe] hydrogenase large subunit C-terminal domain-containing protein, partial [Clostridium perfringens]